MSKLTPTQMESPFFRIEIDGNDVPESITQQVQELDYLSPDMGSDTVSVSAKDKDYYFLNNPELFKDLPIKVSIGYLDVDPILFEGYVVAVRPSFPDSGVPSVSLFCMDESHKLNKKKRTRTWSNMKVSDILVSIAREYGLQTQVAETEEVYEKLTQSQETDIQFISKLVNGESTGSLVPASKLAGKPYKERKYVFKVRGGTLYLYERDFEGDTKRDLWYNSGDCNLISFSPAFVTNARTELLESASNDSTNGVGGSSSDVDPKTGKVTKSLPDVDEVQYDSRNRRWVTVPKRQRVTAGSTPE